MTERLRREKIVDQRPPSRHMRSLLRQSFFRVYQLLRDFEYRKTLSPDEAKRTRRALELCRRATARDPHPAWLATVAQATPPTLSDAVAALNLVLLTLSAVDITWRQRLLAAGLDPKWPETA